MDPRRSPELTEAFPWDTAPRHLLRDRDASYGSDFCNRAEAMGITEVVTAPRSPWQKAYVETVIGSAAAQYMVRRPGKPSPAGGPSCAIRLFSGLPRKSRFFGLWRDREGSPEAPNIVRIVLGHISRSMESPRPHCS